MRTDESLQPLWLGALAMIAAAVVALRVGGVTMVVGMTEAAMAFGALFCLTAERWLPRVGMPLPRALLRAGSGIGLCLAVSLAGLLASYAVAMRTTGWSDGAMVAADRLLGFDWRWAYNLSVAHPAIVPPMRLAYAMISRMPFLVVVGLALTGRDRRLADFLRAYALALGTTVALFALFPCKSALVELIGTAPAYMPSTGTDQTMVIEGLRSGAINRLQIDGMIGIIGFPSFHVQAAILFTWAIWPLRAFRGPALLMNAVMILATPVEGAHYLIDVLAGAAVAMSAILVVRRRRARRADQTPASVPDDWVAAPVAA